MTCHLPNIPFGTAVLASFGSDTGLDSDAAHPQAWNMIQKTFSEKSISCHPISGSWLTQRTSGQELSVLPF